MLKANRKDKISLSEVVKGMIASNSNANTDFLIYLLWLQNINDNLSFSELNQIRSCD